MLNNIRRISLFIEEELVINSFFQKVVILRMICYSECRKLKNLVIENEQV